MEIIKKGKIPEPVERIAKCKICKTKVAYKESDISQGWDDSKYIRCPLCKGVVFVFSCDKKFKRKKFKRKKFKVKI